MSTELDNKIVYILMCIGAFAEKFKLSNKSAYNYLRRFKALDFLDHYYDVEHTQSIEDSVDDITRICKRNGGQLS
jgi:hypothetical protein